MLIWLRYETAVALEAATAHAAALKSGARLKQTTTGPRGDGKPPYLLWVHVPKDARLSSVAIEQWFRIFLSHHHSVPISGEMQCLGTPTADWE